MSLPSTLAMTVEINPISIMTFVVLVIVALVVLKVLQTVWFYFLIWFQATASDCPVSLAKIIAMTFRRIDARKIVFTHILLSKAGISIPIDDLETCYLNGGNVDKVATAMVSAKFGGIPLTWKEAADADKDGRDIANEIHEKNRASKKTLR